MMCSSSTSLHALRKGRLAAGETVLVVGAGGLGMSAVQLARALGAADVIAVDRDPAKLALAERFGARTLQAADLTPEDVVAQVRAMTHGRGVDVALELVGKPDTMRTALQSLAPLGRAVVVGLSDMALSVDSYRDLIGREAELIGSNDHLLSELYELVEMAHAGVLDLTDVVTHSVPLQARDINEVLDALGRHQAPVRTVVVP
jgi:propanol-preferring alcohol dehydrogenase